MKAPPALWKTLASQVVRGKETFFCSSQSCCVFQIRSVFRGKLTVASNWSPPPSSVSWWSSVDYIGIDAYFPLKGKNVSSLVDEWKPIMDSLEQFSSKLNMSVIFTEIGFPDGSGLRDYTPTSNDYTLQAAQYEALFVASLSRRWFLGTFWWNWVTDPAFAPGDDCYTPQWKV
jgi:hypothetical protein